MRKGKGKGWIILSIALTLIIVLGFGGVKSVKANKVNSLIQLGNKYISQGNYKEAIIEFEKAININDKNIEVKETLDVLYLYEEIDELVQEGNFEDAHNKLEEIKDMPKFDIIKDFTEKIEETINEELLANGMGNSIHNTISKGLIAYKGDVVFYRNNNDGGKLYKKDLKTGEELKLTDDFVTSLNVYRDYVYYLVPSDPNIKDNRKIKKVKNDGTENELVLGEGSWISSERFQIIDGILYYESNGENHTQFEKIYNIVSLNLETKESKNILTLNNKISMYGAINEDSWILNKNSEGKISIYSHEYDGSISFIEDINDINKSMIIDENASSLMIRILGIDNNKMYYNRIMDMGNRNDPILYIMEFDDNNNKLSEIKRYAGRTYSARILGDKYYYYMKNNSLIGIDLNTGEEDEIKKINNIVPLSIYQGYFFEVKGYLAYFNKNNELVIDKDILIRSIGLQDDNNEVNKKDEESNILSSLPSEDIYELNKILSFFRDKNRLMDGYDRENINMENIARTAFLYDSDLGGTETMEEDFLYVSKGRTVIDNITKKLFNIDIDTDMLSSDLHEAIYGEDFENRKGIAFKDDKYYIGLASGRFQTEFALADEIIKNDNTYTINFTMYKITDHNYFESRHIFIETGEMQGCEVLGTGIAEVREDVVNGEKVYYFTKYNEIPN